jgi:hypothetical protein
MIDAKELRLGNWANYGNDPTQVTTVWLNYIEYWESRDPSKKKFLPEKMFSPIPLTEEWLLRFGFIDDYSTDSSVRLIGHRKGDFWITQRLKLITSDIVSVDVKHVHSLQNLYFALTGEELKRETK